jgi:alpha-beta hydrolase superfamily lysophospholipase
MMTTVNTAQPAAVGPLPTIDEMPADGATDAVVLVLHGGRAHSAAPTQARQLSYLRMVPFGRAVHRARRKSGTAVWLLRNRVRGWNEPACDAVRDAEWALARIAERHPAAKVVLLGHSMGARAALRVAGADRVVAVCALAPWVAAGEPVSQLAGRAVLIAHGDKDTWTDRDESFRYAVRARAVTPDVARFEVHGSGHPMLRRAGDWTALVNAFTGSVLGTPSAAIEEAMAAPAPDGLRRPLPQRFGHSGGAR